MTAVSEDVHLDGFLGEVAGNLLVEVLAHFEESALGLDGFLSLLLRLDEGNVFLPAFLRLLLAKQLVAVAVAKDDCLLAEGEEEVVVLLNLVQVAQLVNDR